MLKTTGLLSALVLMAGCAPLGTDGPKPLPVLSAAKPSDLQQCASIASAFQFANTQVTSAQALNAGAEKLAGKDIAAHCLVKGRMFPRKGSDGRDYAIGFEMRLPNAWNGRFYYQGNGGLDGAVQPALGALGGGPLTGALTQGFAVISSDAGHTMAQTPFFGAEPQARLDYYYQATEKLTPMAKALIAAAYGRGPDRSYIGGCSNGGRHAMVAAARLGDQYDGYLAGAPGYRLPAPSLTQLWGSTQWNKLATPGATRPHPDGNNRTIVDLASAFTPVESKLVADAILAKCDSLDGVKDGMVQAIQACQSAFNLDRDVPTCASHSANRGGQCLSKEQKTMLNQVHAGPVLQNGQPLYSAFPWDTGIAGRNWADWKFIQSVVRGPISNSAVFVTPPTPFVDPLNTDVDARRKMMDVTNDQFTISGMAGASMPGHENPTNLRPLWARGAKMLMYHGAGDAVFSSEDSRQFLERADKVQAGRAADSLRLFVVPGMNHCSGGFATDQFDMLTPLVKWVEQGIAPDSVIASARGPGNAGGANPEHPAEWSATRTRPLCATPKVAHYKGSGSIEDAANFSCR